MKFDPEFLKVRTSVLLFDLNRVYVPVSLGIPTPTYSLLTDLPALSSVFHTVLRVTGSETISPSTFDVTSTVISVEKFPNQIYQ